MKQYDQPAEAPLITAYKLAHTLNTNEGRRIAALISDHNHSDTAPSGKPVNLARLGVTLAYVVMVIALGVSTVYYADQSNRQVITIDPEREYYRGINDATAFFLGYVRTNAPEVALFMFGISTSEEVIIAANEFTASVHERGWYEQPSEGFEYK